MLLLSQKERAGGASVKQTEESDLTHLAILDKQTFSDLTHESRNPFLDNTLRAERV